MEELLVRYLHFFGIILLASTLAAENVLIANRIPKSAAQRLARINTFYGISAVITFTAGLLLWLVVGKPSVFYSSNPIFHLKLGLFIVVALLSIWPTVFFINQRNSNESIVAVPNSIMIIKRLEALILLALPLLAVLMARGVGYD